ncbi:YozE family protein [Virgibacillus natechei]
MTFKNWIKQFIDEDSPRGDLARDIEKDMAFPDTDKFGKAFYRLHIMGACREAFSAFTEVWREYKAETGENRIYFELMDEGAEEIFSEFIKEKESYQFFFKLESINADFDILSEPEGDEENDVFLITLREILKRFPYRNLDEVIQELESKNNIIQFPMGRIKRP